MGKRVLHDRYFQQAKREGYAARSAYKLKEIDDRNRLLRSGMRVLDLGCAPGSWLQVIAERVGPRGEVVGIDLKPVRLELPDQVRTEVGDAFQADPRELLGPGGAVDSVMSDMAPNTSGAGDDLVSAALCRDILARVPDLLRPGGSLVMKIFEGAEYTGVLRETQAMFRQARGLKPRATREVSREMFIIATGYRGTARPERRPADRTAPPPPAPKEGWS